MSEEYGHISDGFFLSDKEVEELRNVKKELTEYGKQRLKELIYKQDMHKMEDAAKNLVLENLTHEEMLEEAARREAENKALAALDELSKQKVFDVDK